MKKCLSLTVGTQLLKKDLIANSDIRQNLERSQSPFMVETSIKEQSVPY